MADMTLVEDFARLFQGRTDIYATWTPPALHEDKGRIMVVHDLLSADIWRAHLDGTSGLGIYCALPDNTCWWGCVDIDDTDDPSVALNIQTALRLKDVTSWVERTAHGFHVWVFVDEPVALKTMSDCLRAACAAVGYKPKEVNPKQNELTAEKPYGNWVRLPYGPLEHGRQRSIINNDAGGEPITLLREYAISFAVEWRNTPTAVASVAALCPQPKPITMQWAGSRIDNVDRAITDRMSGLTWTIWHGGPLPEANGRADRSQWLVRLARQMWSDGFAAYEILAVLREADVRVGKFVGRSDADVRLKEIVERAR